MKIADIPEKFNVPFANAAAGGLITYPIPEASQIAIAPGRASLETGFVPTNFQPTGAGGVPPFGKDFNGLLKQITLWNRWNGAGGLAPFDSAFATAIGGYPKGAIIASNTTGLIYLCTADDNTANPNTGGANWLQISWQPATQAEVNAGVLSNVFVSPLTLLTYLSTLFNPDINFRAYATSGFNAPTAGNSAVLTTHAKQAGSTTACVTGVTATRFTVPAGGGGWYMLFAGIGIATQNDTMSISLRLNGATLISSSTGPSGVGSTLTASTSTYYKLAAGDYVEPLLFSNANGGTIQGNQYTNFAGALVKAA